MRLSFVIGIVLLISHCVLGQSPAGLTLEGAIQQGLDHSPEVKASSEMVAVQRGALREAGLRLNPRLFLQSEDLRPWDDNFSFPDNTEDYAYVSQTFELGGKRRKRVETNREALKRSEAEHGIRLRLLSARIVDAYWYAAEADAAVALWRQQLDDYNQIVEYHAKRVTDGATAGVDLLRIQIERDRVAIRYNQAQQDAEAAKIQLAREMGIDGEVGMLADSVERSAVVQEIDLQRAVEQRGDVQAAEDAIRQAAADVKLQHANGVPDLDLLGGYKRNSGFNTVYTSLQIPLPIFNRNQGGTEIADANRRMAEDELARTKLQAAAEIRTAEERYQRVSAIVAETLPAIRGEAQKNATIISEAYASGGMDLLRYLDAKRTFADTQLLAVQTLGNYQRAAAHLKLAYGEQP